MSSLYDLRCSLFAFAQNIYISYIVFAFVLLRYIVKSYEHVGIVSIAMPSFQYIKYRIHCNRTMNDSSTKTKILLGITGSVAAVKGPELALALSSQIDAHVVVLLTQGGEHFWNKAEHYNPNAWKDFHEFIDFDMKEEYICRNDDGSWNVDLMDKIMLPFPNEKQRRIILLRECYQIKFQYIFMFFLCSRL